MTGDFIHDKYVCKAIYSSLNAVNPFGTKLATSVKLNLMGRLIVITVEFYFYFFYMLQPSVALGDDMEIIPQQQENN